MKATLEVELQPFQVPNFVRPVAKPGKREDGFVEIVDRVFDREVPRNLLGEFGDIVSDKIVSGDLVPC